MKKRLLSLLLVIGLVMGMLPASAVMVEPQAETTLQSCLAVKQDAPTEGTVTAGALYVLSMSDIFADDSGHTAVYSVVCNPEGDRVKIKDGTLTFSAKSAGTYTVKLTTACENATAEHSITLTVSEAGKGIAAQYGYDETAQSAVTVFVTLSNNGYPLMAADGTPMAHMKVTVPYFDLGLYGLENFYRYATENGQGEYTGSAVIQRPTGLHLYLYMLERYYMGLPEEKCGKGTSNVLDYCGDLDISYMDGSAAYQSGGTQALSISGGATSLYMVNFWGHDENLMYFRNHCYPLMSPGWGSTSDYILLSDGDTWDVAMFSNWDFYHGGWFAKFDEDAYTATAGDSLTVQTLCWGTTSEAVDFQTKTGLYAALYDSKWNWLRDLEYEENGSTLVFSVPETAGTYYLMALDPDARDQENAKGAPATAVLTVTEKVPVCEEHVDANGDKYCDVCKTWLNRKPVLKDGVSATREDDCLVGYAYNLTELQNNLVFEDADGDTLNYTSYYYQRSTDGGETWSEMANFQPSLFGFTTIQFTETEPGTYLYRFRAYDGYEYSDDTYTLTLHVSSTVTEPYTFYLSKDYTGSYPELRIYRTAGTDADAHDYVGWFVKNEKTVYVYDPMAYDIQKTASGWTADGCELHDYMPVSFTDSLFGEEGTEENPAVESGTVVSSYAMYYALLENGKYAVRAYAKDSETGALTYVGGQQLILPTEVNVDGGAGGGRNIYLRQVSIYSNTKKDDGSYFTVDEYDVAINMSIMQCKPQHGGAYVDNGITKFPFYIYAAGNAATFTIVTTPKVDGYAINQQINCTQVAGYGAVTRNIQLKKALTLTVTAPAAGNFDLYFQWNNFNTTRCEAESRTVSGDTQTLVYKISASEGNYTWRLTDPAGKYVTRAGWLSQATKDTEMTVSFDRTDKKSHDFSGLGTTVVMRDEADIQVFLNPKGFMSTADTYRIRSFRMWELINSDTANIMVEPDTHVQVLQGNAGDIQQVNGGNAGGNWIDVTATTTDIVAVHYDAIDMDTSNNSTHGGFFPATNPERTGIFVITNNAAGGADAHVAYNRNASATSRSEEWDYNYDTWFYMDTDQQPTLDFTVYHTTGNVAVSYANVTTSSAMVSELSDWNALTADGEGRY